MAVPSAISDRLLGVCPVSRETLERLDHLVVAIAKWSPSINLVADSRPGIVWERHVLDSAQLLPLQSPSASSWCDLGSGAGFPGLVIGVLARELMPSQHITLVESDRRKATFLSLMVRELDLRAAVHTERAEVLEPRQADVVSARAVAPLERLLGWVHRHLAAGGIALLPKGRGYAEEIAEAQRRWAFTVEPIPSMVAPQSRILRVTELRSSDAP